MGSDPTASPAAVGGGLDIARLLRSRAIGRGLRVAIVLPLVLLVMPAVGLAKGSFLAALAVIAILVLGDFSGPRPERAASIAVTASAGAVTLALGAVLADNTVLVVIGGFLLGTVVALFGVLRGFMTRAMTPILMPYLVAATTKDAAANLAPMELGWLLGSATALVAALVLWPYFPRARLTEALGTSMVAEAGAIRALWGRGGVEAAMADAMGTGDAVRRLFTGQLGRPGNSYRRERLLVGLVEEVRRLRLGLRTTAASPPVSPPKVDVELAEAAADALVDSSAAMLAGREDYAPFDRLYEARITHRAKTTEHVAAQVRAGAGASAVSDAMNGFPARAISMLSMVPSRDAGGLAGKGQLPPLRFRGQPLPTTVGRRGLCERLRAQLTWRGPWGRNAVRLGLALALALAVVELTGVERGYWVVLGTLSVLRLDVGTTGRTAWQVVKGQVLGFGLAALLVPVIQAWHPAGWLLLPLLAFAQGYAANNKPLMIQQMAFTALLVDLVMISQPMRGVALLRLGDVLLGLAIGVAVSLLVFPRGVVPQVAASLTTAVRSASDLLVAAAADLGDHVIGQPDGARAQRLAAVDQGHARRDLERASETVDLAITQGSSAPGVVIIWLRAVNLITYAAYVGDLMVPISTGTDSSPEAARVAADLTVAARAVGERLQSTAARALRVASLMPPDAEVVDAQPTALVVAPELAQVRASLEAVVDEWAGRHDVAMADRVVHLCWALGWLTELDAAIQLSNAQLDAFGRELDAMGDGEDVVAQA